MTCEATEKEFLTSSHVTGHYPVPGTGIGRDNFNQFVSTLSGTDTCMTQKI